MNKALESEIASVKREVEYWTEREIEYENKSEIFEYMVFYCRGNKEQLIKTLDRLELLMIQSV